MINENVLKRACTIAYDEWVEEYIAELENMPNVSISAEEENQLLTFIKNLSLQTSVSDLNKNTHKSRKTTVFKIILIAAIFVSIAITAFAVSPLRGFISKTYDDCCEFVFDTVKGRPEDYMYAEYMYIPEGYVITDKKESSMIQMIVYTKDDSGIFISSMKNKGLKSVIDTENAEAGEIEINNSIGFYSITDSSIILIWSTGKYNHSIVADTNNSNITLDEVVKIAKSRQPIP